MHASLGYDGGSVEKPFDRVRPAYQAGATVPLLSGLSGRIGVKYGLGDLDALYFSTGVVARNPFHEDLTRSEFADPRTGRTVDRYNVSNPVLSYSHADRFSGLQSISGVSGTYFTESDSVQDMHLRGSVMFSQTLGWNSPASAWGGGATFSLWFSIYDGAPDAKFRVKYPNVTQEDFGYAVSPYLDYALSPRVSVRTVLGLLTEWRTKGGAGDPAAVTAGTPYQSLGLGFSVTREIYLFPNIQFTPFDIRADRTNTGLSANLSLF